MSPPSLIAYMHEDVGESTDLLYEPSTSFDMCMDPSPHPNTAGTKRLYKQMTRDQGAIPPRIVYYDGHVRRRACCLRGFMV